MGLPKSIFFGKFGYPRNGTLGAQKIDECSTYNDLIPVKVIVICSYFSFMHF